MSCGEEALKLLGGIIGIDVVKIHVVVLVLGFLFHLFVDGVPVVLTNTVFQESGEEKHFLQWMSKIPTMGSVVGMCRVKLMDLVICFIPIVLSEFIHVFEA